MVKRKKQQLEAEPVDKLDRFVKTHFKKILAVAGVAIVAVLAVYGIMNMMDSRKQASYEGIGQQEVAGLYTTTGIADYVALAESNAAQKDYLYYQAGTNLLAIGNKEAAIDRLQQVGGNYKVFAESLLYDITGGGAVDTALLGGKLAPVWYYRSALNAQSVEEAASFVLQFRILWPDSELARQLTRWGI